MEKWRKLYQNYHQLVLLKRKSVQKVVSLKTKKQKKKAVNNNDNKKDMSGDYVNISSYLYIINFIPLILSFDRDCFM